MSPTEIEQMKASIQRIETAVCGDEKAGIPGLAANMSKTMQRVQALEDNQTRVKGGWVAIVGLSAGLAWLWTFVKDFFISKH